MTNLWERLNSLVQPPDFPEDEEKSATARTLYVFLGVLVGALLLLLAAVVLSGDDLGGFETAFVVGLIFFSLGMEVLLHRGFVRAVGISVVAVLWVGFSYLILSGGGIRSSAMTGYFLVIVIASLITGMGGLFAVTGLTALNLTLAYYLERSGSLDMSGVLPSPFHDLVVLIVVVGASSGVLSSTVRRMSRTSNLARERAAELEAANRELMSSRDTLSAQTARLQRRTAHLDATMTVAQEAVASVGDTQGLLDRVVSVISEQFGYYHAGIFWIDPSGEWAVLQSASSPGGRRMVNRGHRLRLGTGIVGYVAASGESRIALDVGEDAVFFDNPDLPETRSEMAVPLTLRGQVIGVLDVQSREPAAFDEEDVSVLGTVAEQISLALANARLLEEAQQSVTAMQRAQGQLAEAAWQDLLRAEEGLGFISGDGGTLALSGDMSIKPTTLRSEEITETAPGTMAVPVKVGSQVLGYVEVHLPPEQGTWTPERVEMLDTLSAQLSEALERARLYRDTQKMAVREQLIRDITDEMGRAANIESLMRITAEALNRRLGGSRVYVRLTSNGQDGS